MSFGSWLFYVCSKCNFNRIVNALLIFVSYVLDGDCIGIHSTNTCPTLSSLCRLYPQLQSVCDIEHGKLPLLTFTVNSTMDFSVKPIEEGVVDSPPNTKLRMPISCSPLPVRSMHCCALSMSPDSRDKGTQRKLYGEETIPIAAAAMTSNANETALPLPTTTLVVAPTRRRVLSSQQGRFKRPKQSGSFSTVASTLSYDSWKN